MTKRTKKKRRACTFRKWYLLHCWLIFIYAVHFSGGQQYKSDIVDMYLFVYERMQRRTRGGGGYRSTKCQRWQQHWPRLSTTKDIRILIVHTTQSETNNGSWSYSTVVTNGKDWRRWIAVFFSTASKFDYYISCFLINCNRKSKRIDSRWIKYLYMKSKKSSHSNDALTGVS